MLRNLTGELIHNLIITLSGMDYGRRNLVMRDQLNALLPAMAKSWLRNPISENAYDKIFRLLVLIEFKTCR